MKNSYISYMEVSMKSCWKSILLNY